MNRFVVACLLLLTTSAVSVVAGTDRIYGRVSLRDGTVVEGPIKWGRNESSWYDVLDGSKQIPEKNKEAAIRAGVAEETTNREVRLLGFTLFQWEEGHGTPSSAQSGIRFGHIRSLEPIGRSQARLILKSGEEVVLGGSSDVGVSVGQIIVEEEEKEIRFRWDDIEAIEFLDTPKAVRSKFGERLYGTVLTEEGGGFTGFICWDLDEMFTTEMLDGESEKKDTEVAFGEIASIEKRDSFSALVTLKTGDVLTLTGTNDVNADNRGILVLDPMMGQVRLSWSEFAKLVLKEPPEGLKYQFDGGAPFKGTVETVSGDTYHGMIRWDNDEEFGWELLDGNYSDLEFDVEIGLVRSIEKKSHDSSVVSLLDGRSFELQGSNDVDGGNKGIFILLENGEETVVRWQHFSRVDFDRPDPG